MPSSRSVGGPARRRPRCATPRSSRRPAGARVPAPRWPAAASRAARARRSRAGSHATTPTAQRSCTRALRKACADTWRRTRSATSAALVGADVAERQREDRAAVAHQHVGAAQQPVHRLHELADHAVAGPPAVLLVDAVEADRIHEQERARQTAAAGAVEVGAQHALQLVAAGKPGERIGEHRSRRRRSSRPARARTRRPSRPSGGAARRRPIQPATGEVWR